MGLTLREKNYEILKDEASLKKKKKHWKTVGKNLWGRRGNLLQERKKMIPEFWLSCEWTDALWSNLKSHALIAWARHFFRKGKKKSWSVPRSCWTLNVEYMPSLCFYSLVVVWNTSTSQSWSVSGVFWSRISIYTAIPLSGFAHLKYFALPEYLEVIVHLLKFSAVIRKFRAVTAYRAS